MDLAEFQRRFAEAILTFRPEALSEMGLDGVFETGRLSPEDGLEVYQGNTLFGLASCLADTFPATGKFLGKRPFDQMALEFVRQTPPDVSDLAHYGEGFPDFLADQRAFSDFPYLADLARLEWAFHKACYAPKSDFVAVDALAEALLSDTDDVQLFLPRSASYLTSLYPIHRLWDIAVNGIEDMAINWEETSALFVWRRERSVLVEPVAPDSQMVLAGIILGQTVGTMAAACPDDRALYRAIAQMARSGWLARFTVMPRYSK